MARVELGSLNYSTQATLNGAPTVPIGIFLQPGANALEAAAAAAGAEHSGAAGAGQGAMRRLIATPRGAASVAGAPLVFPGAEVLGELQPLALVVRPQVAVEARRAVGQRLID